MSAKRRCGWKSELRGADFWFRYRTIDIRDLDGEQLLVDNVIAILARLRDHRDAVRKIVKRIAGLPAPDREAALGQLLVLAGLKHLEESVCHLRHKVAAPESITWPALRQNPFQSQQRGSLPRRSVLKHKVATSTE
ncbi:MAG: hypothetical protein ABSH56_05860 [Bryobacteraceae bacterium]|jgi:hypothetical protein